MWRKFRIAVLLFILATILQQLIRDQADLAWKRNLYVALYPVNIDHDPKVDAYIHTLNVSDFEPMAEYFSKQAAIYHLGVRRPIELQLGDEVYSVPPYPPKDGSIFGNIVWSLEFRYFAWRHSPNVAVRPAIKLYLLFYDPKTNPVLSHSTALKKGRIGRVNLFGESSYSNQNLVILAHELLHTLNAKDKYDLDTTLPIYPDGFAEPNKSPLYPQKYAELMAGRIAINKNQAEIPENLSNTLIGAQTAHEIGWYK